MKIKGVNLGNWLVLEKWMSPYLYRGTDAADEYYLPRQLSREVYEARIMAHRSEYITERDFATIKRMGLNSVRIPVPYFIFGDCPPFIGCIEELDKAFSWAKKYDISVLIDLHTVPGSQNGFDNGGISGVCTWSQDAEKVEFALQVLEKLAKRYGDHEALLGIEPVNEPVMQEMWDYMKVQERYVPVDKELGAASKPNTLEFIQWYYLEAYKRLRAILPADKKIVFHDAFDLSVWKDFFAEHQLENVILDTHQYLMMAELMGCGQNVEGYLDYIKNVYARDFAAVQEYVDIICGEWCMFNSMACGVDTKGGLSPVTGLNDMAESMSIEEKRKIYLPIVQAQLDAWNQGTGYYYWTYKMLLDTVNEPNWNGWDSWDLGMSVDQGWFPQQ